MNLLTQIQSLLNDPYIVLTEQVQPLWSGYGQIVRCKNSKSGQSYIVKVIAPESASDHPRGWNTSASHQRKIKSYQVEANFYKHHAQFTDPHCKTPKLIESKISDDFTLLVMEDLDAAGFSVRKGEADWHSLSIAIRWLAYFHAKFMGNSAKELWQIGTYWHLNTRQDELLAMPKSDYKKYAQAIDKKLSSAKFQTLVHGDAKFENLCFHQNGDDVAAVDFQYIGGGSGVKDLAYLVGSCLNEEKLIEFDTLIVNEYLKYIKQAFNEYNITVDINALTKEVTELYPVAWADFYRFLLGWNPQSWKICDFMKEKAQLGLITTNAPSD